MVSKLRIISFAVSSVKKLRQDLAEELRVVDLAH